ncbi:metallo-beta-lactamase protein, putative [Ichthyophthirius multifiliis]|uniref:Metallo-beta-lactamase protein, putative n=1 Tax=Ichthyophthirius multifiliis TaxID=5932 RepID=G0QWJ7_ICHMU|nr:metallo-beta-lactamase protein, putative [Ichthyophthirius multifiliis]EGR30410.1 metallo-beta-lactamase protein, putative [Ichthyophthirius multifiliis]|eukprot:XP_004031997.1 metallo-beta-lactamase protein, putative [Ichthyophthirius multifiliis]
MPEAIIKIDEHKNFYIIQLFTACLSEMAYYIESDKEAIIIDPMREIEPYYKLIQDRGSKLKYVFETHFHADFVSGHIELNIKTGAQIIYGPGAKASYQIKSAKDEEIFQVGKIKIKVLHTPGHTLESSCYLLLDENDKQYCVFTGDTLFLGEVGRPDLAVKGEEITCENLAELLYDSLRNKIMKLEPKCIIYPGHGSGSACGKKIQSGNSDTLENQLNTNYALNKDLKKEDFVKVLTTNIGQPPQYFFHSAEVNMKGYEQIEKIISKSFIFFNINDFLKQSNSNTTVILDTRNQQDFLNGFIPGSINIPLSVNFAVLVGTLFPPCISFLLVTDGKSEKQAIIRLARIGYDKIIGCLQGGFDSCKNSGVEIHSLKNIKALDAKNDAIFLDVRNKQEFEEGKIKGALNVPFNELANQIQNKVFEFPKDKDVYVYCRSGTRSSIACSILRKLGFCNQINIEGGFNELKNNKNLEII